MKTKIKQKQNIPEGWKSGKLLDCFDIPSKLSGLKLTEYKKDGEYPVFDQGQSYISGYSSHKDLLVENTPAILFGDHTRVVKFIESPFVPGADGTKILWAKKTFDSRYLYYALYNAPVPNTGYNRHFKYLKDREMTYPESKKEQQKIAEVLGAVDQEIEKTKEVIKATEKLKKGLMQKLFTKGIGHTKFKQTELGEIPESWDVVDLENVAQLSTGTTPSTSKKSYYEGEIAFIKTGQVVNNRITQAEVHVSEEAVDDYRLKKYKPGTVFMAMYGQGKTRGQVALLEIEACTTQNAAAIEPSKKLDSEYLWFFFKSQYERLRQGGVQGHISHLNLTILKKYQLALPPVSEQKKIVEVLVAVDEKIMVSKKLLAKQTELKKGLMQDLLSGVKRVNV